MRVAKPSPAPAALLYGVGAVSAFLGISSRQALYLIEKGSLPVWRDGRTIMASQATVLAWIAERERNSSASVVAK